MERKVHSVKYNFIMNFFLTATQFIFPIITFPYVTRVLQAEANGKLEFATAAMNYFMMVASLGIPTYGVRACARVRDNQEELDKTVQELFIINSIVTGLVMLTYIPCIFIVPKFAAEKPLFFINGINILLNMFGMNHVYRALEQYDYITFRSIAFKIISIILMFLLVHKESDYVIYGGIVVFAAVGSYVLNFIRMTKIVSFKKKGQYNFRRHMKPIMILFSEALATSIYTNMDALMLGFMKTDVDVGYYGTAIRVKRLLLSVVTSLGSVLLPRMSYYVKKQDMESFKHYLIKGMNFTVLVALPLSVFFVIYAAESILFLAGKGYEGSIIPMMIITPAIIPIGLTNILGIQVLTPLEKEKYLLISVIIGAATDFVLNLVFIPYLAATGAALATTIAEIVVLIVQIIYTRQLLAEVKKQFRFHLYIAVSAVSGLTWFIMRFIPSGKLFLYLLIAAVLYFAVYGIGMLIIRESLVTDVLKGLKAKLQKK